MSEDVKQSEDYAMVKTKTSERDIIIELFSEVKRLHTCLRVIDDGTDEHVCIGIYPKSLPIGGSRLEEILLNHKELVIGLVKQCPDNNLDYRMSIKTIIEKSFCK